MPREASTPERTPGPPAQLAEPSSRRTFLKWSGAAGLAVVAAACADQSSPLAPGEALEARAAGGGLGQSQVVNLGQGDIAVLNYAYALEQLEAAFYTMVVARSFGAITDPTEREVLRDLRAHEITHREFFELVLGRKAIAELVFDFSSVDFGSRTSVLQTARTFEDLGVGAYNGAAQLLENTDYLLAAGKIVSVEARHASAIRHLLAHDGMAFAPSAFDPALPPSEVLAAADPFIVTKIIANNLPSA